MNKITSAKEDQEARMVKEYDERRFKRKEQTNNTKKVKGLKKKQIKSIWTIAIYSLFLFIICTTGYLVLFD